MHVYILYMAVYMHFMYTCVNDLEIVTIQNK